MFDVKISAVYIAKNEAHNIARSLDSIRDSVDELVLVDTGSADETVKIFESYGGKVYHEKWADDFSAPRNIALSKATGDWIIILDADESFSMETRQNIRAVLAQASAETNGLLINMINYDKDTGKALDEFYALRIVRNIPGLNYKGRIHEMMYIGEDYFHGWQRVSPKLLTIDHTGYTASISLEKNQRNIRLMEAAIRDGEPAERYYTNLFESYSALGNMERALYYAQMDVARGRQSITYASRSYRGLISYYAKDTSSEGRLKHLQWVEKAVKDFPELPDFHAEYSECLYRQGRYREAKREIELALSLCENYDGLEPCLLTPKMKPLMEQRKQEMTRLAEKQPKITISACAIVKNEESNIYGWLKNVSVFADEIIINDTGSEDRTKELIARFSEENPDLAMVLIESLWQDDFSFAKNQCLAEATGDWIVFTDADETFVTPEKVRCVIGEQINGNTQVIMVPMANVDRDDNNNIINTFSVPRIFRREEGLCYEGRIHEMITIGGRRPDKLATVWADKRLFMEHTGYSTGINEKKAQRNLILLLKDIEDGQDIEKLYQYLAESYYALGNYAEALNMALLAIQSAYQPIGHQGDMYWLALNAMEKLDYSPEDKMAIVEGGIRLLPKLPDFYARKGSVQMEAGNYHEAIKSFNMAWAKIAKYEDETVHTNASNLRSILHLLFADWGRCLYRTGYSDMAEEKYREALKINPWTETALCGWADIYQGRTAKDFIASLEAIYADIENSRELLSDIYAVNGFPELAGYFFKVKKYSLINEKDYSEIYNKSMKEMAEILPALFVCLLGKYNEEYVKLLPDNLKTLVNYLHGKSVDGEIKECFQDYSSFMKAVMDFGTRELLVKYLGILDCFATDEDNREKQLLEVAGLLLKNHWEKEALELYQLLPDGSSKADSVYYQNVGFCLFREKEYAKALEFFQRAEQSEIVKSYIIWCREAMENGN